MFSVPGDVRNAVCEADDALTRERESLEASDAFGSASSWLSIASPL